MEINKKLSDKTLTVTLKGRLDTNTSGDLEVALRSDLTKINKLVLDFKELTYVSSAGLRVLLATRKFMNKHGDMIIRNVCPAVMEVFQLTGFDEILTIE
ncbi:MAG: STAS domain-containing protein [Bacilli bacterium]|nr:STAS domain-containing protein [Bacilli bacterium]